MTMSNIDLEDDWQFWNWLLIILASILMVCAVFLLCCFKLKNDERSNKIIKKNSLTKPNTSGISTATRTQSPKTALNRANKSPEKTKKLKSPKSIQQMEKCSKQQEMAKTKSINKFKQ